MQAENKDLHMVLQKLAVHDERLDEHDGLFDEHRAILADLEDDIEGIKEWMDRKLDTVNDSIKSVHMEALKSEPEWSAKAGRIMAFVTGTAVSLLVVALGVIALLLGHPPHIG